MTHDEKCQLIGDLEGASLLLNSAITDLTNRNNELLEGQRERGYRSVGITRASSALLDARMTLTNAIYDINSILLEAYNE